MGSSAIRLTGKVNLRLLEAAMNMAISEVLGGTTKVEKDFTVRAMDNSTKECLFGFKNDSLRYGIGVAIENNQVKFFGDDYGVESTFAAVTRKTQQQYTLLGLAKFAHDRGMKLSKAIQSPADRDALIVALEG